MLVLFFIIFSGRRANCMAYRVNIRVDFINDVGFDFLLSSLVGELIA